MYLRSHERKTRKSFSGKTISVFSLTCFVCVFVILIASNRYMNFCLEKESSAQRNRAELTQLGESLSDASDYLTDEVRKFAITGDISHLYNYWYDVLDARTRDNVINTLKDYDPPDTEGKMLSEAKRYSDLLINTETESMKLMLLSMGKSAEDFIYDDKLCAYVDRVMEYELPEEYTTLSREEMSHKSVEILFDSEYSACKEKIMSPISTFKQTMKARLDKTVNRSEEGMKTASAVQLLCSAAVLALIGLLLIMIYRLYTKPLNSCTEELSGTELPESDRASFAAVRVTPRGAYELKKLTVAFNRLSAMLCKELENRRKAEENMRAARDEADKANSAKSEFLARMSHELRTPLNAVIGYLYLMEKNVGENEDPEKLRSYIEKISLSAENLLELISDILDFSKIESGSMQFETSDFSLRRIIKEVSAVTESGTEQKNLKFTVDIDSAIPDAVKGDFLRLKQVLVNLLGNSLKFTEKGEIRLSAELLEQNGDISLVHFCVSDTGIGIKDEDKKKILEPFVQSDAEISRKYGGTGLGLSICNMIVSGISQGRYSLEISSVYGKGSEFSFNMEFPKGDFGLTKDGISDGAELKISGSKRVLLVDDSEINLEMESEILRSFGVETVTADSGKKALCLAEENSFDMILLDIRMPDMDGCECARKLRRMKNCKYVPIIALSADVVSGVPEQAVQAGMNDYCAKPVKPRKLYEVMEKYFRLAVFAPEEIAADRTKYFDFQSCLYNLSGNEKALLRLADKFLKTHGKSAKYVELHIQSGDNANARKILHNIIGTAGNLGCRTLSEAADRLRLQLHRGEHGSLEEFTEIWDKTCREISAYLSEHSLSENHGVEQDVDSLLSRMKKLAEEYDITAAELFEENSSALKKSVDKQLYQQLKQAAEKYDFSLMIKVLEQLA